MNDPITIFELGKITHREYEARVRGKWKRKAIRKIERNKNTQRNIFFFLLELFSKTPHIVVNNQHRTENPCKYPCTS